PPMKWSILFVLILGGGLFTTLIVWYGAADILAGVVAIGWGILPVILFRIALLVVDMLSWHVLIPREKRIPGGQLFWIRWVADSVNTLLPVARIGGEFLRALMLHRRGVEGPIAGASVMVDLTAGILTQFIFSLVGVMAFAAIVGGSHNTILNLTIGLALFGAGLAAFYALQRSGPFLRLARLMERFARVNAWAVFTGGAAALDAAVIAMYRQRRATTLCCFWRIVGWVAGTGEVWLILTLLGHPVTLTEAFVLESLGQAARSAGFMIPGGLGVQEGGLILIGNHIGLTPELALTLSLIKRGRELIVGIPGLVAWQIAEGRSLWQRRNT
ncbi:MAG: lysylphosphatidylglycerol synthase domain-containing protein, partial [Proteobacteria bacterium]|nr:lysylphosphatidylglycerol synthase domain-containing protein [Pseudomonadota bacterium]